MYSFICQRCNIGLRLGLTLTIIVSGRKVVEDSPETSTYDPSKDEKLKEILEQQKTASNKVKKAHQDAFVANPSVLRPTFIDSGTSTLSAKQTPSMEGQRLQIRIQDASLQEMGDDGWCLSMHQPWASYLVAGVKIHEGRNWYSPHRGRLWIHAASKVPTDEEIAAVQQMHLKRTSYVLF